MTAKQEKSSIRFNTLTLLLMLFNGIIAIMYCIEFIQIKLLNNIDEYPFGTEGPYYYETADIYIKVISIFGLIHAGIVLIAFWVSEKKIKWGNFIVLILSILVMAAHFFSE